jgi:hypothetical protein
MSTVQLFFELVHPELRLGRPGAAVPKRSEVRLSSIRSGGNPTSGSVAAWTTDQVAGAVRRWVENQWFWIAAGFLRWPALPWKRRGRFKTHPISGSPPWTRPGEPKCCRTAFYRASLAEGRAKKPGEIGVSGSSSCRMPTGDLSSVKPRYFENRNTGTCRSRPDLRYRREYQN